MRYVLTLLIGLGAAACLAPAPQAQPLSKMLADSGLSPADFKLLGAAEMDLLRRSGLRAGHERAWSNPDSGARGTVRAVAVRGNCVDLLHVIHAEGRPEPAELQIKMCKSADGRWLLTL